MEANRKIVCFFQWQVAHINRYSLLIALTIRDERAQGAGHLPENLVL